MPKFGIIVPLAPFGMPDYDETERFDLRVSKHLQTRNVCCS